MADVGPNYHVEQQRLKSSLAALRANIEAQQLAILEMADRAQKHRENIAASLKAISEYEANLRAMEAAHGILTKDIIEAMYLSLDRGVNNG